MFDQFSGGSECEMAVTTSQAGLGQMGEDVVLEYHKGFCSVVTNCAFQVASSGYLI